MLEKRQEQTERDSGEQRGKPELTDAHLAAGCEGRA